MSELIYRKVKLGNLGYTYPGLSGKTKEDFGFGKPYIPYMNIFTNSKVKKTFLEYVDIKPTDKQNKVQKGDLFFTTSSETVEEVGMTSVLLDDIGEAYLNSFCFGFRLYNFDTLLPEFAAYLFRSEEVRKKISLFGQGSTRYNLPKTQLFDKLYLNIPDKERQIKIYNILTTCDTVIEQTQAAIEKYKAIKQGMLHDLFTRGLDANGQLRPTPQQAPERYKNSELGLIPKEWEVKRLEELTTKIGSGVTPTGGSEIYQKSGVLFIRSQNVLIEKLSLDDVAYITSEIDEKMEGSRVMPYDVLLNITGASIGRSAFFPKELESANVNQHVCIIRFKSTSKSLAIYASSFLNSNFGQNQIYKSIAGGNREGLNFQQIKSFHFPCISKVEMGNIANIIELHAAKLQSEEALLAKYQSIKKGLMKDLLSGEKPLTPEGE